MFKTCINFSENFSVRKLDRHKYSCRKIWCRKICFRKFGVRKFDVLKIPGYQYSYFTCVDMAKSVPCLENIINNDILCYISTSRHSLNIDSIVNNIVGFYKNAAILKGKETM